MWKIHLLMQQSRAAEITMPMQDTGLKRTFRRHRRLLIHGTVNGRELWRVTIEPAVPMCPVADKHGNIYAVPMDAGPLRKGQLFIGPRQNDTRRAALRRKKHLTQLSNARHRLWKIRHDANDPSLVRKNPRTKRKVLKNQLVRILTRILNQKRKEQKQA